MSEGTFTPLNTGNPNDDDALIIDENFEPVFDAPAPPATELVTPTIETWPALGRLFTSTYVVQPAWAYVNALPKDPYRKHMTIRLTTVTGTDSLWFADDGGKLALASTAFVLTAAQPSITIDDFTGTLYFAPNPANSAAITVCVMGVSK